MQFKKQSTSVEAANKSASSPDTEELFPSRAFISSPVRDSASSSKQPLKSDKKQGDLKSKEIQKIKKK